MSISCQRGSSSEAKVVNSLPDKIDFNFHIRPILSDRCFACHGPDEKARKAEFRLDLKETAFAALDSIGDKYAIVAGDLAKSELVNRIHSKDGEAIMPPPESNLSLSQREIDLLTKWIEQGAEWKEHWAFIPPQKSSPPTLSKQVITHNPIDNFIIKRLEQEGLFPSKEASKEKLIRRLSFDLRGIPPSIAEIDAFLKEESTDTYQQLVDNFLAQESYGERMAMEWLDIARYADSHGYQDDLERSMWPWRDWVIDAFNKNMPYRQFVEWQLAGDLLPNATYEQKLATGFNRNHKITQEVGVVDEEYRVNYVLDRVNTFSTAFLGLTVECAQCHDHKYDPISQKEYYQLFSFFNNVPEKGRVDYGVEVAPPSLPLPEQKVEQLRTYVQNLWKKEDQAYKAYLQEAWRNNSLNPLQLASKKEKEQNTTLPKGLVAWYPLDYVTEKGIQELTQNRFTQGDQRLLPILGKHLGGFAFTGHNYASLPTSNSFNFNQPFSISFWIQSVDGGIKGPVLVARDAREKINFRLQVRDDKTFNWYINNPNNKTQLRIQSLPTLPKNEWAHVVMTYDGTKKVESFELFIDGIKATESYAWSEGLKGSTSANKELTLGAINPISLSTGEVDQSKYFSGESKGLEAGLLDELMLFNRPLSQEEVNELRQFAPFPKLLAKEAKSEADKKRLFHNQLLLQDPQYQRITERLKEYTIRRMRLEDIVVKPTMVMEDTDTMRPTFVLDRGQYNAPTEQVEMGTPQAVLALSSDYSKNRLGLARWLFDINNPLTARVVVNRYWQMIFGKGLVSTPGDFGSQGSLPSHPELLDWLAVEFQESDWDVKHLLKLMVTSATYRQSVQVTPAVQQRDPDNILLARGPQYRLPAEMIRDHALAISGLLSNAIGGPSVKPYQPKGLWLEVASGNQSLRKYIQDHHADLYRKSMYTFWKRTVPPPSMTIFDAPTREQCVMERRTTNTPMQALVLLNDPQFTEASRLIAARMLNEGGDTEKERIQFAFRLATSRTPTTKEVRLLRDLLAAEKADYKDNPQAAKQLIAIGEHPVSEDLDIEELAAYTVVANAILNLTEAVQKG